MAQPPGVLVIRGSDPRQTEFAALLYGVVSDLVRKGATSQSIHVLDVASHPALQRAHQLTPFDDVRRDPPFLLISQPVRRVMHGRELEAFTQRVVALNQPPPPPPVAAPTAAPPPPAPTGPPAGLTMSTPTTGGVPAAPPAAAAAPPPPPPELKMSTAGAAGGRKPQTESVNVELYQVTRTLEVHDDEGTVQEQRVDPSALRMAGK